MTSNRLHDKVISTDCLGANAMTFSRLRMVAIATILGFPIASSVTLADQGHKHKDQDRSMIEQMREMHRGHEHGHDFKAMEEMGPEQMQLMLGFMREVGLVLPPMDAGRGRNLFVQKGCVVCHSVNKVGGDVGPPLNAADMPKPMNAFEFAARMWRGAQAMTAMQQEEFGEVVNLDGQELADLIAFAHDTDEQKKLTIKQVPKQFRDKIGQ